MSEVVTQELVKTQLVVIRDVRCAGRCTDQSDEEATSATHIVFPYRGLYVRHLGHDDAVAEANQAFFFNAHEGYRVTHPVPGGDASLDLVIDEDMLRATFLTADVGKLYLIMTRTLGNVEKLN